MVVLNKSETDKKVLIREISGNFRSIYDSKANKSVSNE